MPKERLYIKYPILIVFSLFIILNACQQVGRKDSALTEDYDLLQEAEMAETTTDGIVEQDPTGQEFNTESYDVIFENEFLSSTDNPLSTFSIDVDNASYTNTRRFIKNSQLPPKDAVRIEEFINYFDYDYPQPGGEHPFSVNTEYSKCPWSKDHNILHIGIQGKSIPFDELEPSNLVFLIDVSGSMDDANKLPLLKQAFKLLVNKLGEKDRVSIVVYAGASGLVLPATSGEDKKTILKSINKLSAGGSTAGGEGLKLAYKIARENLIKNGNNRIILATDGDFNIGPSSDADMNRLMEENRDHGVFITVLGFGIGNYKDSKMEEIADYGNGNYFYIDELAEAKKVLVTELGGTLHTIAKDVKIQIEFNPTKVKAYRLIGYENRMLNKEDFNDDKKDAGELGAGHTVTALYEIVTTGSNEDLTSNVDKLKDQKSNISQKAYDSDELVTIKLRYKEPDGTKSKLIKEIVKDDVVENASANFRFSAAVASFGMLLSRSLRTQI